MQHSGVARRHASSPPGHVLLVACGALLAAALFGTAAAQEAAPPGTVEPPGGTTATPASSAPAASATTKIRAYTESLVVTATASPRPAQDLPYTLRVAETVRSHELDLPRDLAEVLSALPGVSVQRTAAAHGSAFLRGLTGFRTLYLVDGVRVNNSTWREGPNPYASQLSAFAGERIEVLAGAGAVLYGTDAIGGTLQQVPAPLETAFESSERVAGTVRIRGATNERSLGASAELTGVVGSRFAYRLSDEQSDSGDFESGGRRQPHTGYGARASDFRGEWRADESRRLVVALHQSSLDDVWRTHSTRFAVPFAGTTIGTDARRTTDLERRLAYSRWISERTGRFADRWQITASWHWQSENEDRIRASGERSLQELEVATTGLHLQVDKRLGRSDLGWGLEAYRDQVATAGRSYNAGGALRRVEIQGPVADDASYDLMGAWLQDRVAWGRNRLVLGLRATEARVDARRALDPRTGAAMRVADRWSHTVGEARLLRDLAANSRWQAFIGLSQAFRAPNLSDLTRFDSARSGEREIPSPGLRPERFLSSELGLRAHGPSWRADLTLFHTAIDDLIVRTPTGRLRGGEVEVTKTNAGKGRLYGVELSGEATIARGLTVRGWLSSLSGTVGTPLSSEGGSVDEPIDRLTPPSARLAAQWRDARDRWGLETTLRVVARQDRLSAADRADAQRIPAGGTPGYVVIDLMSRYRLRPGLSFSCRVENLTDRTYRVHGSGVNEPGRSLVFASELRF